MSAAKVAMGYLELVTNSDTLRALSKRCAVQMQRGGGAAIRHPYLRFMCTRCGGYHAVVLATCNWQQGAPQQGQRVRILARSSSLKANTAGALDLYRSMFYKRSTYIYISFSF